jgi:DNA replication protein DnaC
MAKKICIEAHQLKEKIELRLRGLRLGTFADEWLKQYGQPTFEQMSFEKRLSLLLDREMEQRKENRTRRLVKGSGAHEREHTARLEDVLINEERGIKAHLWDRLKECDWMLNECPPSLLITGMSGCGKTFISCAFLKKACEMGLRAKYIRAPQLCAQLSAARKDGSIERKLTSLKKVHLLIIDDLGVNDMNREQCSDLLDVIMDRYDFRPTIYASQYPIEEWVRLLPKEAAANAILDRVIHGSYLLELKGESLRKDINSRTL